ncbi:MAG: hypothetical protein KGQ59_10280, partial [Bdellovibrionales bacterium]|nr:hypothetical protein [Bdellovibrionales bacterium]
GASSRSQRETGKQGGGEARGLVDLQEDIKTNEEAQQAAARKFFLSANKTYADSVKPLLGRNVTLSLDACTNAKPAVQANCMDQISKSFEDLYLGKSDLSKVNMVVPGNGAVRDLVIQCMGLKGCTADLQAQHDYLKNTVKQVDQSKQKFAAEANQKIDSMRTSLARAVAFPNQLLIQQQDELNRFLAGLGVSGSISLEDIEGKAFEKDDDEDLKPLYKNPVGDEFIQGISAGSTPPLKKVGKDSFNEAYKGIAEGVKQADEKIAKLNSLQDKMMGAMSKCQKQEAEKKAEEQKKKDQEAAESQKFDNERNQMALDSMVDDANDIAQCGHVSGWCNSAKKNEIQRLLSSVQQLDSKSGNKLDTSDIEGFLQTAISGSSCREGQRLDDGDLSGMGRDCKSRVDSKITEMKSRLSRRSSSGSSSSSSAK